MEQKIVLAKRPNKEIYVKDGVLYKSFDKSFKKSDVLNEAINQATATVQPPTDKGKRLRIYYMTQTSVAPPTFVIFCNSAELFHFSYQRYIENCLRDTFGFAGTPIKLIIREKGDENQ